MIRRIDIERDYDEIKTWWTYHHYTHIHTQFIPEHSYVYEDEECQILGCMFVYYTDQKLIFVDHLTVNPEVSSPKLKFRIINELLEYGRSEAKEKGYLAAIGHTKLSGFRKFHKRKYFYVSEPKFSLLLGIL